METEELATSQKKKKKKKIETLAARSYALLMKLLTSLLLWADVNKVHLIMFSIHTYHNFTHLERNFNNINLS